MGDVRVVGCRAQLITDARYEVASRSFGACMPDTACEPRGQRENGIPGGLHVPVCHGIGWNATVISPR